MSCASFPSFQPHPLLRNPHAQTLAGVYMPGGRATYSAKQHYIEVPDGDHIVLHEDCPADWQLGDPVALLIHGLGGSYLSPYMVRIAARLCARGVRTFRKDLRGCGAGFGLARYPFHSGRSEDAAAAVNFIARQCPNSPIKAVGFSLGGNITLKLLAETEQRGDTLVESALVVCPPIDLETSCEQIIRRRNRLYDRHFVQLLLRQYRRRGRHVPGAVRTTFARRPRNLWELDEMLTAPICGFGGAVDYYRRCSSAPLLERIKIPTTILAAADDPLVPVHQFTSASRSSAVRLQVTSHGGHLGFIARRGNDADRRWLDWRVVQWVLAENEPRPELSHDASAVAEPDAAGVR